MQICKKAVSLALVALLLGPLSGCGSGAPPATISTTGPTGKVAQGAVSGATVWADATATGTQFVIDTGDPNEQTSQTTTSSTGAFTLPVSPTYKYVLVSQGGTDTVTGELANTLLAPGGAQSISPLTTLVTLDTSGNLADTINALLPAGNTFDSDLTAAGGLTPAAMVFLTSITTAVTTFDAMIEDAAHTNGATLTQQQINYINLTVYSKLATQFSTLTAASLENTADLASNMESALSDAISAVEANDSNITVKNANSVAESIANNSVAIAANIVGNATGNLDLQHVTPGNVQSTGVDVSTSGTVTEASVISSGNNKALLDGTITSEAASEAADVTANSTPSPYSPNPIPIINNPTVVGYELKVTANGNAWTVTTFTITFSDDMDATTSGHSVLNAANYQFTQSGCTPTAYAAKVVSFTCSTALQSGTFGVTVYGASSNSGVWASATSLGLSVNNVKTFTLPAVTGSTGGSSLDLF